MRSGISFRGDFDGEGVRRLSRQTKDVAQVRRLLALASIYDGGSRSDAARLGNVTVQIVRDWVMRLNERGPAGLINGKAPGPVSRLNNKQSATPDRAIEREPTPYFDGVVRWRLCDLAQWLWEEFRVSVSEQTLSREVRSMGYRKLVARPKHYAQDPQVVEDFKKFPRRCGRDCRRSGPRKTYRDLVRGRSPYRPKEQDHAPRGQARNAAFSAT
jgi:transposase